MQIIIDDKDSKLRESEKAEILQKFEDISKILMGFHPNQKSANLHVQKGSRWGYKMSFSLWLPKKKHIFAEVKEKDFEITINKLKTLVVRQVTGYKDKLSESSVNKKEIIKKLK